jgi:hypothetical protein
MIEEIQKLIDEYQKWLKSKVTLRQIEDWVEITTPYLDRHNDYLQIYVKHQNGGYLLTDDGYIINDLISCGCEITTEKRQRLLNVTLGGFGVRLVNSNELQILTDEKRFALDKHNLIQAMLSVNDLFYMAGPLVRSLFYEDVEAWLDQNEIRYTPRIKFTGKSGYDHNFDFVIAKSRKQPERILKVISKPTRDTAQSLAFSWFDTKEFRAPDSKAYACLNDEDEAISDGVIVALRNYEIVSIVWSKRENYQEELIA